MTVMEIDQQGGTGKFHLEQRKRGVLKHIRKIAILDIIELHFEDKNYSSQSKTFDARYRLQI